jgi:dTDP-glucose pyrophosphorylase
MRTEDIRRTTISPETSLKAAMKLLSAASGRVLFVIDGDSKLIGSVTDGDIRRAILNNIGFDRQVGEIMFKSTRFVRDSDKDLEEKARRHVLDEKLHAIPVLNGADRIVDIFFWYDYFEKHPHEAHSIERLTNPIVIMAGGKGERLDPFTRILPKPLIPIGDKPIVEKIMDGFSEHGFADFILTLNYKKEMIKSYFRENRPSYNVEWVEEESYLGTAGSLRLLKDKVKETFYVCNCDVIVQHNFSNILLWHKGERAIITMIGCHKEMVIPYGTLSMDNGKLQFINEKPVFDLIINTGVYLMEPEVLSYIEPDEKIDMNQLIERVLAKGKVTVYPISDGWFDVGQWKEYKDSLYMLEDKKR